MERLRMPGKYKESLIYDKIKQEGYPFAHCSNITELNDNYLMAQWYTGKGEQNKNQSIFAAKFNRKAQKWQKPYLLSKTTDYPEGNGIIWKHPKLDKLFLFYAVMVTHSPIKKLFGRGWKHCQLFYKISNDLGDSWSEPYTLKRELNHMVRNKPILLKSGRILLPMYIEDPTRGMMGYSDDDGETFQFSSLIEDDPEKHPSKGFWLVKSGSHQPTIVQFKDGRVLALFRTTMHKKIFYSISKDEGVTWSYAKALDLPNPDSGIDMVRLDSGRLVLIFNNAESGRHDMSIAVSHEDNFAEWKVVKNLENDPKMKFSYPALIQTLNGNFHGTYTYDRKTIKHIIFNEKWLDEKK